MHTYFQNDPKYRVQEYKNIQFKKDKGGVIVIAFDKDVSILLEHHFQYNHKYFVNQLKINHRSSIPEPIVEQLRYAKVEVSRKPYVYHTPNYLPFGNKDKVDSYYEILDKSLIEKGEYYWEWLDHSINDFLEDLLHRHIFGFLQSVSRDFVFNDIDLKIFRPIRSTPTGTRYYKKANDATLIQQEQKILFKKFDLFFSSNILLPRLIGLGNSINIGYGTMYRK